MGMSHSICGCHLSFRGVSVFKLSKRLLAVHSARISCTAVKASACPVSCEQPMLHTQARHCCGWGPPWVGGLPLGLVVSSESSLWHWLDILPSEQLPPLKECFCVLCWQACLGFSHHMHCVVAVPGACTVVQQSFQGLLSLTGFG